MPTIDETLTALHVDKGDNDEYVESLLLSACSLVMEQTGIPLSQIDDDRMFHILVLKLVESWYYEATTPLQRVIDSLTISLKLKYANS